MGRASSQIKESRLTLQVLTDKPTGRRSVGKHRHRLEDGNKINLKK